MNWMRASDATCLFGHLDEQAVQVRVRVRDRQLTGFAIEQEFVARGAVFHGTAQEARECSVTRRALMGKPHPHRPQLLAGELPADAQQRREPEFELMPIVLAAHAGVDQRKNETASVDELLDHALIDQRSKTRATFKNQTGIRRGEDVIEQPGLARVEFQRG
jgi:hypothetical protein